MSITNIINDDEVTLVQGVNGLFLCEESWITESRKTLLSQEDLNEKIVRMKNERTDMERPLTDLLDLT